MPGLSKDRWIGLIILSIWVASCVTPVIPLPPPDPQSMSLALVDPEQSLITMSGRDPAMTNALIFLFNQRAGQGVITRCTDRGAFATEPFEAIVGDRLDMWATRWADESPSSTICLEILGDAQPEGFRECRP